MNLVKNIGFVDQIIRGMVILDILAAYFMGFLSGLSAFIAISFALALIGSCITAHCPLYSFLGFTTRQEYEDKRW